MPATPARVALITSEYRYDLEQRAGVLSLHPQAREVEEPSYCSTQLGANAVNDAIMELMSGSGRLIEVNCVDLPDLDFDRLAPTVRIEYAPLDLSRDVVVVGVTSTVGRDGREQGTLLLW